jgi:hypothetical protein
MVDKCLVFCDSVHQMEMKTGKSPCRRWHYRSWGVCAPPLWKVTVQLVRMSSLITSVAISRASSALCQQLLVCGWGQLGHCRLPCLRLCPSWVSIEIQYRPSAILLRHVEIQHVYLKSKFFTVVEKHILSATSLCSAHQFSVVECFNVCVMFRCENLELEALPYIVTCLCCTPLCMVTLLCCV